MWHKWNRSDFKPFFPLLLIKFLLYNRNTKSKNPKPKASSVFYHLNKGLRPCKYQRTISARKFFGYFNIEKNLNKNYGPVCPRVWRFWFSNQRDKTALFECPLYVMHCPNALHVLLHIICPADCWVSILSLSLQTINPRKIIQCQRLDPSWRLDPNLLCRQIPRSLPTGSLPSLRTFTK